MDLFSLKERHEDYPDPLCHNQRLAFWPVRPNGPAIDRTLLLRVGGGGGGQHSRDDDRPALCQARQRNRLFDFRVRLG